MQFPQLRLADLGRRIHQQIRGGLSLREGDHVADAVRAGHQHRQPVETKGDAAVRRGAELERIEQESEFQSRLFRRNPQQVEHGGLQFLIVDSHRAAADLRTVEHHVVGLGDRLSRTRRQCRASPGSPGW